MTSMGPENKPGKITYTGSVTISKPRFNYQGDTLSFRVTDVTHQPSEEVIQHDRDGVPHNLLQDIVGKKFVMSVEDRHPSDAYFMATNDQKYTADYGVYLDCDQRFQNGVEIFAVSRDGATSKEIEGTLFGQLRYPGKPPLSCLVPSGFIYCPTAKLTSVEERGRQGGRLKYEPGLDRKFTLEDFEFPDMEERTGWTPEQTESVENLIKTALCGKNLLVRQDDLYRTGDLGSLGYTDAYFPIRNDDTGSDNLEGFNFILHGESRCLIEDWNTGKDKDTGKDKRHRLSLGWKPYVPSEVASSENPEQDESVKSTDAARL